ncbi:Retrovirus-related Pol polyprotein from transposon 297 family [Gossypium australe]|uniref:Retrovirus-related Pol polyprotein from transposon 297 family n=1 Tax=Gossypium australe TaxID=47621 RepID=A0A5B6VUH0_9ROSI|nr:Retrovirus-related Pol polyprotein from transposon 297 family [Gossypium australe]
MLQAGIIRDSNSSFASPIVMVKKKDDTWRMCMDYKHLNQLTIKDRFPMPLIEALLDELRKAVNHLVHLRKVFDILRAQQLFAKKRKCHFGVEKIDYLRHTISSGKIAMDKSKIENVMALKVPQSVKEFRGFLGLSGCYRRFIKSYGSIAKPLISLLKKGIWNWTP